MKIVGIETDAAEIDRVVRLYERYPETFANRVFTPGEQARCFAKKKIFGECLAARWAAKEATMKALGVGWAQGVDWLDVEVVNLPSGAPQIRLTGGAKKIADALGIVDVQLSLTHCKTLAIALLLGWGVASLFAGVLWGAIPEGAFGYCPIVKKIWTPSMTLYAAGLSLVLLSLCYLFFDVWRFRCFKTFFVVLGANAIVAYMGSHLLHFNEIAGWLLYGLEQYVGVWYPDLLNFAGCALLWLLLWAS